MGYGKGPTVIRVCDEKLLYQLFSEPTKRFIYWVVVNINTDSRRIIPTVYFNLVSCSNYWPSQVEGVELNKHPLLRVL